MGINLFFWRAGLGDAQDIVGRIVDIPDRRT